MITETGRVVAIESDSLWVETIQKSTCGSCAAQKGCGQSVLARLMGHTSYIRVLLQGRSPEDFRLGQEVDIGVPESLVVRGSLFVYLVPLMFMLLGAGLGDSWAQSDAWSAFGALLGLVVGGLLVRWRADRSRRDPRLQPVLLDAPEPLRIMTP